MIQIIGKEHKTKNKSNIKKKNYDQYLNLTAAE